MIKRQFLKESLVNAPARDVFDWHKTGEALEKLIPPSDPVTVVERTGGIDEEGSTLTLRIKLLGPLAIHWVARHQNYVEGRRFEDVQVRGPFAHWVHSHEVEPVGETQCRLRDRIEYALPLGWLGDLLGNALVRRKLESMFDYRHRVTREELETPGENPPSPGTR